MKIRVAVASLCVFVSSTGAAQLTGSFHLEKTTFARGEPIFLYFSLVNKGPDTAMVLTGDPDQPGCSGIFITVSSDPSPAFCPSSKDNSCNYDGPLPTRQLLSGQTYTARFLLNFNHNIDAIGDYWVDAKSNSIEEKHSRLTFRIEAESITSIEGDFFTSNQWKRWLERLQWPALEDRQEAAKTIASLASPSLEEIMIGFADSPEFQKYSPLAFHRLNTRRSIEALAGFMKGPVSGVQIEAAHYLAETNDQVWYPLLRDAAEKNARISSYPTSAAELGGDKILPLLVALEKSPDRFTHLNAVMAMGSTHSRAAIPILLNQLRNPDVDISDRASYGLQLLTHRTAIQDAQSRNREAEYIKWSRWWKREGAIAPIYRDSECGERLPLP